MGKGNMAATIVEINKERCTCSVSKQLQMVVKESGALARLKEILPTHEMPFKVLLIAANFLLAAQALEAKLNQDDYLYSLLRSTRNC